jgi:hypothetical protein
MPMSFYGSVDTRREPRNEVRVKHTELQIERSLPCWRLLAPRLAGKPTENSTGSLQFQY